MTGIAMTVKKRPAASAGGFDSTSFSAEDIVGGGTSEAYAEFYANGTAALFGNRGTSPASPIWWSGSPPATWMSYSSTGTGVVTGGLTAGTRYQINTARKLGVQRAALGEVTRTFTISYYDAASGGNLVGTKTFTASAESA